MKLHRVQRQVLILLALVSGAAAHAQLPADDARERERVRAERAAAEAAYVQQVQVCSRQFVVTACVDAARAKRHQVLTGLDRQQAALDEARRKERAAQRLEMIESKVSGEEARRREDAARQRSANRGDAGQPRPAPAPASAPPQHAQHAASPGAQRAEQEARARRAYELKQLQAEAHRQEVERRNEQRSRKAKPAAPLPLPAASAVMPMAAAPAASAASSASAH